MSTAAHVPATEDLLPPDEPTTTFADLGLPDEVVRRLAHNGVTVPFPIQVATIPDALAGRDILGRGRTGSGKTLSFGLPLLTRLSGRRTQPKRPRGLILTPTRELAMQVSDALQPYGDVLNLRLKVVCGGTSMGNQIYALERGVDILVATPGRLRDIINRGACSLEDTEVAVLDEADQMADLGFLPEVTELLDLIPSGGQRMLFSATLENEIDSLVKRYLVDPVSHEVDAAQGAVTTMSHHVLVVKPRDKAPITSAIAARKGRTIVFVRTQLGADRVAEQLREVGVKSDALHGGMTQGARTRTLADFKDGRINVLVATDVAARGIHVDGIDLVLNVDPAGDHKDYLHRSGRTARAGRSGIVVSLALPHQRRTVFRLMEDAGVDAARHMIGRDGLFNEELAAITGARSLTELQAEAATGAARHAEREATRMARELERAQAHAAELRSEAESLIGRAAKERGEDPTEAIALAAAEEVAEEARRHEEREARREARRVEREARGPEEGARGRDDRREGRGGFRRDDRGGRSFDRDDRRPADRDNRSSSYQGRRDDRRDDRGGRGPREGFRRDGERGGFRRDDRGGRSFDRDDRRPADRDNRSSSYQGRRDDRGGRSFDRDDRRPADRDNRSSSYQGRRDDRGGRSFDRDNRSSSYQGRRDDRGGRSFDRTGDRRDEAPRRSRED
ncbi:DEAD/DEAH box helicase [Streptomyces sp. ST2-7A]|uniref:DEAD/DEAH box helicase n=1 Tax=Streptomyces sp. ST2-7A TaxID=2907214 RepID=UPI001F27A069|nr:DEAD/DEAH box helicase [Streptomyces sp. ST2-7A]MCE7080894.1 DEAD/DEAH box helicase [Streptomyces sp. ST2-7A]